MTRWFDADDTSPNKLKIVEYNAMFENFTKIIASHSLKMQRMVYIFQRNRLEHKETFRKQAMAMDGLLSEHEHKMQQQEIDHFVREIKQIHLWDVMGNKILVVQRHKLSLRKQQDSLQKRRRRSSAADVGGQSEGGEEEEGTGEGGEGTRKEMILT